MAVAFLLVDWYRERVARSSAPVFSHRSPGSGRSGRNFSHLYRHGPSGLTNGPVGQPGPSGPARAQRAKQVDRIRSDRVAAFLGGVGGFATLLFFTMSLHCDRIPRNFSTAFSPNWIPFVHASRISTAWWLRWPRTVSLRSTGREIWTMIRYGYTPKSGG